jgi:hypothetical protein
MKMAKQSYDQYIMPIGLLALVFLGGRSILAKLGIVTNPEDSKEMNQLSASNYFDPDFYKAGGAGTKILTNESAQMLVKLLYESKGVFNDDEAKVYGVFQSLRYQSQVSYLAAVFFAKYKVSLIGFLSSFLNNAELSNIAKICNRLPKYR